MVVLAEVPWEVVPKAAQNTCNVHQEDYAFALEQAILHHFMLIEPDSRIVNENFAPGDSDRSKDKSSTTYAVYMAFAMESQEAKCQQQ